MSGQGSNREVAEGTQKTASKLPLGVKGDVGLGDSNKIEEGALLRHARPGRRRGNEVKTRGLTKKESESRMIKKSLQPEDFEVREKRRSVGIYWSPWCQKGAKKVGGGGGVSRVQKTAHPSQSGNMVRHHLESKKKLKKGRDSGSVGALAESGQKDSLSEKTAEKGRRRREKNFARPSLRNRV